jgi:putative SOS response-associated peptidase YedK
MCNLCSMTRARLAMLRLFRLSDNRATVIKPKSSIFPGYVAPIVRKADDGERELVNLDGGFVLVQRGLAPRRITNVRDDKILTSKIWRPSFEQRRCPVPASSYCEPTRVKPVVWHCFAVSARRKDRCSPFRACGRAIRGRSRKTARTSTRR